MIDVNIQILSRVNIRRLGGTFVILSIKKNKIKVLSETDNKTYKFDHDEIEAVQDYDIRER